MSVFKKRELMLPADDRKHNSELPCKELESDTAKL